MEKLRAYLNSLDRQSQYAYALRCGTTVNYLRKAICVGSIFDAALVRRLDEESNGLVPREALRPDVWPERLSA